MPARYTLATTTMIKIETASFRDELQRLVDALLSAGSVVQSILASAQGLYNLYQQIGAANITLQDVQAQLLNAGIIAALKRMVLDALRALKEWLTVIQGVVQLRTDFFTVACKPTEKGARAA